MQNFEQFKKDFKRDLFVKIVVSMKHGKTSKAGAKVLAREILHIFKEAEARSAFARLSKLSERHAEVLDIFIKRGYEYDGREKGEKLSQILIYLKNKGGEN